VKVNAYCESYGWLFDDLKREFAEQGASISDAPQDDADAYLCIRASEFSRSPDPARTVVQIHDMHRYRVAGAGCVSLVHPAQVENFAGVSARVTVLPIGSREVVVGELPSVPVIGFFCREVGGRKGSHLFGQAVEMARNDVDFDVLLIGWNLDAIAPLGRYERGAAGPLDYRRITALVTCSVSPMVPLSAYEACAAGRPVITTPRTWPEGGEWEMVRTAENPEGLAECIRETVKKPKRFRPDVRRDR